MKGNEVYCHKCRQVIVPLHRNMTMRITDSGRFSNHHLSKEEMKDGKIDRC